MLSLLSDWLALLSAGAFDVLYLVTGTAGRFAHGPLAAVLSALLDMTVKYVYCVVCLRLQCQGQRVRIAVRPDQTVSRW